jgi:myo-inositol-1(or 4)-monophosphatase
MAEPDVAVAHAELLGIAVDLVHSTGALIRQSWDADAPGELDVSVKSSPTDLVTAVDQRAEQHLLGELARRRPGDAVLAEEGGERAGTTGVRWLVDPIDGTVNFYYGIPQYAVSVAAEVAGETVVGAVHNPVSGETFLALRGAGAWLGSRPLAATGRAASLDVAVVGVGFGYDSARRGAQGRIAAAVLPRVGNLRRLGSAALDLCYVAAGRLDGYYEQGLNPWDIAAGALIAAEAGAVVTGLRGNPPGEAITVAATPAIAGELVTLLEELGADAV